MSQSTESDLESSGNYANALRQRAANRESILKSSGRGKRKNVDHGDATSNTSETEKGSQNDTDTNNENNNNSLLAGADYSNLPLKPDHISRPIWTCPDGAIYLEAFHPLYNTAYDFLVAISEPVARPEFLHEYKLTPYSLYAAVATNIDTESILTVLERLSKNALPDSVSTFVRECTKRYGKARLVLKNNRFYVESEHPSVLRELLRDSLISQARVMTSDDTNNDNPNNNKNQDKTMTNSKEDASNINNATSNNNNNNNNNNNLNFLPSNPVLDNLDDISRLGFGDPIPISAEHGEGIADIAVIIEKLTKAKKKHLFPKPNNHSNNMDVDMDMDMDDDDDDDHNYNDDNLKDTEKPLQLAILGRQNVGKSTLVNSLLNQNRVIAGPKPGLTRDAIAVSWKWNNRPVTLVDTAGIRRMVQRDRGGNTNSTINNNSNNHDTSSTNHHHNHDNTNNENNYTPNNNIEDLAVRDAMRAMKVADVAVLVLDADARVLQRQELAIADAVIREGRSLVIAANKMDLLINDDNDDSTSKNTTSPYTPEQYADAVKNQIEIRFPMLRNTPVVPMSSLNDQGVQDLMPVVFHARDRWSRVIPTGLLNRWLIDVMDEQPPPMKRTHNQNRPLPIKIKYILQTKGRPPTFLLFCNTSNIPTTYMRYLTRHFQQSFQMYGMEVRMAIKASSERNPYVKQNKQNNGMPPRSGRGVGGRPARMKKMIQQLKSTGQPHKKGKRRRNMHHRHS